MAETIGIRMRCLFAIISFSGKKRKHFCCANTIKAIIDDRPRLLFVNFGKSFETFIKLLAPANALSRIFEFFERPRRVRIGRANEIRMLRPGAAISSRCPFSEETLETHLPRLVQRGHYFRRFWNKTNFNTRPMISRFSSTPYWTIYAHRGVAGEQSTRSAT